MRELYNLQVRPMRPAFVTSAIPWRQPSVIFSFMAGLTIEQCQQFATDCRELARREHRPDIRKQLDDMAASWEQLCESLGELAKRAKR
jgi:hypothetical protein